MKINNSLLLLTSSVFLSAIACKQEGLKRKSNVLFILADDLIYKDLSCIGSNNYEDAHEELYNLKTDLSETTDVSSQNPEIVERLHTELFDYLNKVGVKFPQKDPEYNEKAAEEYHEKIVNKLWPRLEKQRKEVLSTNYKPNPDW